MALPYIKSAVEPASDQVAVAEDVIADESFIKAGKRHSKEDIAQFQHMHDLLTTHGATCSKENCAPGDDTTIEDAGPVTPYRPGSAEDPTANKSAEQLDMKAISLDAQVAAVQQVFSEWRYGGGYGSDGHSTRTPPPDLPGSDGDGDYDDYPTCIAVFPDFAIARLGLVSYRVPYTIGDAGAELAATTGWARVEQDWLAKSIVLSPAPASDDVHTIKTLGSSRLGMYLVAWGSEGQRDLTREFFTKDTEELLTVFKAMGKIPLIYHHGMDATLKSAVIGHYDVMQPDDVGLWCEAQLDIANKYTVAVKELARRGALGASSGTLPGARKVASNGEIKRWCIVEGSLTPSPAESRLRTEMPVEILKSFYDQMGLQLPDTLSDEAKGVEEARPEVDIDQEWERLRLFELSL